MKTFAFLAALLLCTFSASAQKPAGPEIPEKLKEPFKALNVMFPRFESKRFPKAPADSVWLFRAENPAVGTVEVGFQDKEVVYMVFRRQNGGYSWKHEDIRIVHKAYAKMLGEDIIGFDGGTKYFHAVAAQIRAGLIYRKDFDVKVLLSGL